MSVNHYASGAILMENGARRTGAVILPYRRPTLDGRRAQRPEAPARSSRRETYLSAESRTAVVACGRRHGL